jgi:GNAT superfamily N-acetyltransferase
MRKYAKYTITQIDESLQSFVQPLVNHAWGGPCIAVNGKLWDTRTMPGLAALDEGGEVIGYLLYALHDGECEIMVLESLYKNIGVGTRLIDRLKTIARVHGMRKVIVTTTNDNINALRFY